MTAEYISTAHRLALAGLEYFAAADQALAQGWGQQADLTRCEAEQFGEGGVLQGLLQGVRS